MRINFLVFVPVGKECFARAGGDAGEKRQKFSIAMVNVDTHGRSLSNGRLNGKV